VAVFPPSDEALIFGRLVDLWGLAETALGAGPHRKTTIFNEKIN
jgi:hypothetical protein